MFMITRKCGRCNPAMAKASRNECANTRPALTRNTELAMSRAIQQINRRALIRARIATLPAISAGTLPAVGASAPTGPVAELDPIFAAIEARKQAEARPNAACARLAAFEESHRGPAGE